MAPGRRDLCGGKWLVAACALLPMVVIAPAPGVRPVAAVGSESVVPVVAPPTLSQSVDVTAVVDKYRQVILDQMRSQHIAGFAIALVDDQNVLWSKGFGCTDWDCAVPVTPATPFSIQSMTKSFTAVAVMMAVQDGILDLDAPISTYLPDFTVNSIFDEHPQDLITLRMLLSHTAGFTHEAPVGNNYDLDPGTWASHVASISETWLKFPVGRSYSYSNLGIDLAGYIVERATGMPFQDYVRDHLLNPLGMNSSSLDIATIASMPDRAMGHASIFSHARLVTIMPSGGCYASAADMARYVQFHINRGSYAGEQLLDPNLAAQLYTPQFGASYGAAYGMGLGVSQGRLGSLEVGHGGGGFGFLSMMTWYPDLKLGVVWLSNGSEHDLQGWLADAILDDVIDSAPDVYLQRAREHPYTLPVPLTEPKQLAPGELIDAIHARAIEPDEAAYARYVGTYGIATWGRIAELADVTVGSSLRYDGHPVTEVSSGLFFTGEGEALDFRGPVPTFRNIELTPLGNSLLVVKIVLGACAFVFVAAVPWRIADAVLVSRHPIPGVRSRLDWIPRAVWPLLIVAALLALTTLVVLTQTPFLVYGGMPLPTRALSTRDQVALAFPFAVAAVTVVSIAGVTAMWVSGLTRRGLRIWATVITGALVVFCALVVF